MTTNFSTFSIDEALETFVRGFSFTRSFTHPYLAERVNGLWVMRDAARKNGRYRTEEWVAHGVSAQQIEETVRTFCRGKFVICAVCGEDREQTTLRADFKALNYRLLTTEPLMIHLLDSIPRFEAPVAIDRVRNMAMAEQLAKAAGSRQILKQSLADDAPMRMYMATIGDNVAGWVYSIDTGGSTWCSDMFVKPEFRRQGIGRGLLSHLLQDDRRYGAKQAVLLASHTGAKLYPVVGYQQIGILLLYAPKGR